MAYKPLHHKYRPQTFTDLVGQDVIAQTLTNAIHTQRIAPAYLFTGPRGTGKTSSARVFAKSLNCLSHDHPTPSPCGTCDVCLGIAKGSTLDVIEIDAASNTGVDNIRELIERSQFVPVQCRYKVYVIDEVHMLSVSAFNALLKTLEEPPNKVVFILATTDPQRVLATIISRCQRFDFRRIPLEAMIKHLHYIATEEKIDITTEAIQVIAQIAQGGLRDAESLLDQLSLLVGEITVERVWDLVGAVPERDLMVLLEAIASDDSTKVLKYTRQIMDRGREPIIVLENLAAFYRDLLIAKTAPTSGNLVMLTKPTWEQLCQFSQDWEIGTILAGQKHLQTSEVQIKNTTQPRLWLEVTLLGLLPSALRKVQQFEEQETKEINHNIKTTSKNSPQPLTKKPISEKPKQQISEAKEVPIAPKSQDFFTSSTNDTAKKSSSDSLETGKIKSQSELQNIWEKVLAEVKPHSTQALLSQQVILLEYNNQLARIGISSKNLEKMVIHKIPNIEAAFEKIFQTSVKVKVEVINNQKKQHGFSENSYPNHSQKESLNSNNKQTQKTSNYNDKTAEDEQNNHPTSYPINSQKENKITPEFYISKPQLNDVSEKEKSLEIERQALGITTRRIVDFFQGKIVTDKTDKTGKSEPDNLSIDFQNKKYENSNLGIDEPEENEEVEFDDSIDF
ncbi:MAG: DNA polymerase III subunit gamma/tau [Trichodesmium sp. MAG_R04]|nr:DNA polymerase III subunit gamma/tau [Trichodesmium sp. MAG_R04]